MSHSYHLPTITVQIRTGSIFANISAFNNNKLFVYTYNFMHMRSIVPKFKQVIDNWSDDFYIVVAGEFTRLRVPHYLIYNPINT